LIRNQLVFKKPWYSLRGHGKTLDCESLALDGAVVEKQQVLADVRDGCLGWLSFVGFFWVKKLAQSDSSPNPWIVRSPDLQPRRFSANLLAVSPPLKRPKISRL